MQENLGNAPNPLAVTRRSHLLAGGAAFLSEVPVVVRAVTGFKVSESGCRSEGSGLTDAPHSEQLRWPSHDVPMSASQEAGCR